MGPKTAYLLLTLFFLPANGRQAGELNPPTIPIEPTTSSQTAAPAGPSPSLSFEVATIKPADPAVNEISFGRSIDTFSVRHASLKDLIRQGWGLKTIDQVQGPGWMGSEYYDVDAKMSESDAAALGRMDRLRRLEMQRRMIQTLLKDRFHVEASVTTGTRPVYALMVAKGGSKLKESAGSAASPASPAPASPAPNAPGPILRFREDHLIATSYSMALFADWLSVQPAVDRRIVVDQTGLTGNYDARWLDPENGPAPRRHQRAGRPEHAPFRRPRTTARTQARLDKGVRAGRRRRTRRATVPQLILRSQIPGRGLWAAFTLSPKP